MNQRMNCEDEIPGALIVARAILAAVAVTLVVATSTELPCIDAGEVIAHFVRMFVH